MKKKLLFILLCMSFSLFTQSLSIVQSKINAAVENNTILDSKTQASIKRDINKIPQFDQQQKAREALDKAIKAAKAPAPTPTPAPTPAPPPPAPTPTPSPAVVDISSVKAQAQAAGVQLKKVIDQITNLKEPYRDKRQELAGDLVGPAGLPNPILPGQ